MLGIQHWPQVLVVAEFALSFAANCHFAGRPRPPFHPGVKLIDIAVCAVVLAYGGFWAVWGWSP